MLQIHDTANRRYNFAKNIWPKNFCTRVAMSSTIFRTLNFPFQMILFTYGTLTTILSVQKINAFVQVLKKLYRLQKFSKIT